MNKVQYFGFQIDALDTESTVEYITSRIDGNLFTQHCVINVAKLINSREDKKLEDSIKSCDIINADGMGIVWGAKFLGLKIPERVTGIDLFIKLLKIADKKRYSIFLLGAREEVITQVVDKIKRQYPNVNIVGYNNGYFGNNSKVIAKKINRSKAQILFVGMSSPLKENFINQWKHEMSVNFVMGVGGTFDVFSGKVKRAPLWMQQSGLEWLFRLLQEPRRMAKRYVNTNAKYGHLILKEKIKSLFAKNHDIVES